MWMASWSEARLARDATPDAQALRRWVARELGKDVRYECSMIAGYAERALPDAAEREGCDWIVLGVQGRTALASYLIGSTTQRILKLSERPVLAVPPQGAPSPEEAG